MGAGGDFGTPYQFSLSDWLSNKLNINWN